MSIFLRRNLLVLVLLSSLVPMSGQVRHAIIYSPTEPDKVEFMDVYDNRFVDVQPEFPGGEGALINFINKTREYPYDAYKHHIQGRALCSFIVCPDGRIVNIKLIRSTGNEQLNREALRVVSKMPHWKPGEINKTKVAVQCVIPINFRL